MILDSQLCRCCRRNPHSRYEFPADYCNKKGWHSLIMQGVFDHKGRFIGWPGRLHYGRVFSNLNMFAKGQSGTLSRLEKIICSKDVLIVLGDPAYPLAKRLMKAFQENGHLTAQQKLKLLTKPRLRRSIACLWTSEREIELPTEKTISNTNTLIGACCVVHNICETNGDEWLEGVRACSLQLAHHITHDSVLQK